MNVHKYLLAAVLGLGICTGNADVWGMKKEENTPKERVVPSPKPPKDDDRQVSKRRDPLDRIDEACEVVIREYIKKADIGKSGNVLAFKCDVDILKDNKNLDQKQAIIILKNGEFTPPDRGDILFERNYEGKVLNACYIPVNYIVNYVNQTTNDRHGYNRLVGTLKQYWDKNVNTKTKWQARAASAAINLEDFAQAQHTEVQFAIMRYLKNIRLQNITANDGNYTIHIKNINEVAQLYSMYEPCESCRELDIFTSQASTSPGFYYCAMDGSMPNDKKRGRREIFQIQKWATGYKNHKECKNRNKIEWGDETTKWRNVGTVGKWQLERPPVIK